MLPPQLAEFVDRELANDNSIPQMPPPSKAKMEAMKKRLEDKAQLAYERICAGQNDSDTIILTGMSWRQIRELHAIANAQQED